MRLHSLFMLFFVLLIGISCNQNSENQITNPNDYNLYLKSSENLSAKKALEEYNFWNNKLTKSPSQFPYLSKIASAQTQMFNATGDVTFLVNAGNNLRKLNEWTKYSKSSYLRSLAINCISQHKFKAALSLLQKAEKNGDNLLASQKMLFDVHLELGNNDKAEAYLLKIQKKNNFDYLIRLSKWKDHQGRLDTAIGYMEKAVARAEETKNKQLMLWAYTNLADFYGHDGQVQKAYDFYLKSLAIDADNAYAKKGIAWITYSKEHNPKEALRIINAVMENYSVPDYYLLKADIAAFQNDKTAQVTYTNAYLKAIENENYGDMYNKYTVLSTSDLRLAFELSEREIAQRPSALSYDLLAWTFYNSGDIEKAAKIMEEHVAHESSEPITLFHRAKIYKSQGNKSKTQEMKTQLLESMFELGPLLGNEIKML